MMQMHGPDTGNMDAKTHEEKQMEREPMRNGKINGDICGEHNDGWGKLSQCFGHNGWGKNFNSRARQYCGNAVNDVVVRIKFVYFLVVSFLWPHRQIGSSQMGKVSFSLHQKSSIEIFLSNGWCSLASYRIIFFFFLVECVGFNTFGVHKNYDFCRQWIWFFWSFSISKCWQCTKMVNEEDESEVWCLNKVKSISIIRVFAIRTFPRQRVECNVVQVVISIMYHRWMYGIKQPQPPPNPNAADSFSQPPEKINQIKCWMLTLLKECSIFHYKCKHALAYAARANKRKSEWNKRRWCDDGRAFCLFARTSAEAQTFTQTQTLAHIFIKSNHIN